jgi:hypothetical protein
MVTIAIASSASTGAAVGESARSSVEGADGPSSVSVDAEQVAAAGMSSNATSSVVDATSNNAGAEFYDGADGKSDDDGAESDNDEDLDNGCEFDGFDGYEYMDGMDNDDFDELYEFRFILEMGEEGKGKDVTSKRKRRKKKKHCRTSWAEECEYLDGIPDGFEEDMRMPKEHFLYLLDGIRDCLLIDEKRSMISTQGNDPIRPEIILCIGLRTLGQPSSVSDMARMYGLSKSSVKRVLKMFFNAIEFNTDIPELQVNLPAPTNPEHLNDLADRWQDLSGAYSLFDGFLGALDGFLARTEMPFDVENPRDYFSGHYQFYGLNVQAMCDPDLLFIYACVAAPGKVNDIRAFFRCTPLLRWLEALPNDNFIGADNAYPLSQKILVPFNKVDLAGEEQHRAFNYYISQLRVRIEMAFGQLTTKWRCLRNALKYSTPRNAQVIIVCMKLHNFCIRMQQHDDPSYDATKETIEPIDSGTSSSSNGFFPTVEGDDDDGAYATDDGEEGGSGNAVNVSVRFPSLSTDHSRRNEHVNKLTERNMRNVRRHLG